MQSSSAFVQQRVSPTATHRVKLKRTKITSHHAPWVTADLKSLMKKRDLAKKKSEKDASYWSEYKKLRNKVTYEIRKRV